MTTKVAILDDYIGVALEYGDWAALPGNAEITVYREAIPPERLVDELADYEVVVITQQRARFPRAVLERLPRLKLLVCNGRTSNVIDHAARIERGIMLCGTADTSRPAGARPAGYGAAGGMPAPSEMAWALILAVAKRTGIEDRNIRAGGWQAGFPVPLAGQTLGLLGAGHLGGAMVPVAQLYVRDLPSLPVPEGMDLAELSEAIRTVHAGRTRIPPRVAEKLAERMSGATLTAREMEVLRLIVAGKSNKDIGNALFISEATVKTHVNSLLSKMGVEDRTQAATTALQRGLVHLD